MTPPLLDNLRLKKAYDLISDKLARVEEELLIHFRSPIPTIDRIGKYLAQGGGHHARAEQEPNNRARKLTGQQRQR